MPKVDTPEPRPLIVEKPPELLPDDKPINLCTEGSVPDRTSTPKPEVPVPVVRCSVIQRTPSTSSNGSRGAKGNDETVEIKIIHMEPEQETPIDYHVPKRRSEYDEEIERKSREARRTAIIARPKINFRSLPPALLGRINGIMAAAAGHGRSSSNGGGSSGGSHSGNGGNMNSGSGTAGNQGSGGAVGGTGSGGGMGGRDGRSNYGPNSPPTGSLPPFYESLKGGNGLNGFNANGNLNNNYTSLVNATNNGMECDTNDEITNIGGYSEQTSTNKQLNLLPNTFGIALKDEQDLDYETKIDPLTLSQNILQAQYGYDLNEHMMVDIGGVNVSDPIQFSATFAFANGQSDHSLLDSLTDAVDLSQLLQRLPNDDQSSSGNDIDLSSTPSITPDSITINTHSGNNGHMESFHEHLLGRNSHTVQLGYDQQNVRLFQTNQMKTYLDNPPPSYHSRDIHGIPINPSVNSDQQLIVPDYIDSHSNLSLPSPGTSSSLDENNHPNQLLTPSSATLASTVQNVSGTSRAKREPPPITEAKLKILQQRVSTINDKINTKYNKV